MDRLPLFVERPCDLSRLRLRRATRRPKALDGHIGTPAESPPMGKRASLLSLGNFSLLPTYVWIVDTGNISAAARSLSLTQSAVSNATGGTDAKDGTSFV